MLYSANWNVCVFTYGVRSKQKLGTPFAPTELYALLDLVPEYPI